MLFWIQEPQSSSKNNVRTKRDNIKFCTKEKCFVYYFITTTCVYIIKASMSLATKKNNYLKTWQVSSWENTQILEQ